MKACLSLFMFLVQKERREMERVKKGERVVGREREDRQSEQEISVGISTV